MSGVKIPKGEIPWVSYYDGSHNLRFVMTSNSKRDLYYLYSVDDNKSMKKLGRAKTPPELERKFGVADIFKS